MTSFELVLYSYSENPIYVIGNHLDYNKYVPLNLSVSNTDLCRVTDIKQVEAYINELLYESNKEVAYGGYGEIRGIYKRSIHFNAKNKLNEKKYSFRY